MGNYKNRTVELDESAKRFLLDLAYDSYRRNETAISLFEKIGIGIDGHEGNDSVGTLYGTMTNAVDLIIWILGLDAETDETAYQSIQNIITDAMSTDPESKTLSDKTIAKLEAIRKAKSE